MEWVSLVRVVVSFAFVMALMLGLSWLARKMKLPERITRARYGSANAEHMLAVEDTLFLDPRHKMVVVRRGAKRHVLVLSAQNQPFAPLLVESYDGDAVQSEKPQEESHESHVA